MANLLHFAAAVASVVALLIVGPRRAQRKAIGALKEYADKESSHIYDDVESNVPGFCCFGGRAITLTGIVDDGLE
jgi:hypothetical protein